MKRASCRCYFRGLAVTGERVSIQGMSRRSRKRKAAGESRWLGKAIVALLVLGVVCIGVGYGMLRSYLHSDAFRKFLSAEAGDAAGVTGEFAPFQWEGLGVDTDFFEAKGGGMVTAVRADGLHTEVGLGGVRRGVWEIRDSRARRLDVSVDTTKRVEEKEVSTQSQNNAKKARRPAWFPSDAEVQSVDVREVALKAILDQGLAVASGMSVHAEQSGAKDSYKAEIEGGTIRLPFALVPELRLDRARVRYQDKQVFLTDATVDAWAGGHIQSSGEWDMRSRAFSVQGNASGLKCEDILSADWSKRLTGDVTSGFSLDNRPGFPQASGQLKITNGTLTALPMLDALAAYADTRRFRVLALQEARTDWRWNDSEISLTNLVLSSEGLVRLEGSLAIRGRKIDGAFRLGLAPGTLATIPGAETDVFLAGERGLLWAPLRITGTLDDPKEDLTDRLIQAAGLRMFDQIPETGEKVIKFTQSLLGEPSGKTVDKGVKIIERGSKTVREVSGILNDILGGGTPVEPEENKEAQ